MPTAHAFQVSLWAGPVATAASFWIRLLHFVDLVSSSSPFLSPGLDMRNQGFNDSSTLAVVMNEPSVNPRV